jgi:hypothetical protein
MLLLIMNFSFSMRSPDSRVAVRQVNGHHRILVMRVLADIDALGLDLPEVRQLSQDRKSPRSGDSSSP